MQNTVAGVSGKFPYIPVTGEIKLFGTSSETWCPLFLQVRSPFRLHAAL